MYHTKRLRTLPACTNWIQIDSGCNYRCPGCHSRVTCMYSRWVEGIYGRTYMYGTWLKTSHFQTSFQEEVGHLPHNLPLLYELFIDKKVCWKIDNSQKSIIWPLLFLTINKLCCLTTFYDTTQKLYLVVTSFLCFRLCHKIMKPNIFSYCNKLLQFMILSALDSVGILCWHRSVYL